MTTIGIDVSKDWLDIYVESTDQFSKLRNHAPTFLERVTRAGAEGTILSAHFVRES